MTHSTIHDAATSNVLAWSSHCANMPAMVEDEGADVDEPPDHTQLPISPMSSMFNKRDPIRRTNIVHNTSLLTKALHSPSEDEDPDARPGMSFFARRRSMASNVSLASTADLTSDTGLTSPSRANTPSPPIPEMRFLRLNDEPERCAMQPPAVRHPEPAKEAPKKRCIQFACAAKPKAPEPIQAQPMVKAPSAQETRRRPCIKFACPVPQRPASTQNTPPRRMEMAAARLQAPSFSKEGSPATVRKARSRSPRPALAPPRVEGDVKSPTTKKYITADDNDLQNESSRFHEFASDVPREDDWIRHAFSSQGRRITIDDTLQKENAIRKLAVEAEEEAEQEEEDTQTAIDEDDDEDNDDMDDQDDDEDQDEDEDDEDEDDEDDDSDGYKTDEETGFADSDEEEEEDEDLRLWTPGRSVAQNIDTTPIARRPSLPEQLSDSSIASRSSLRARRLKTQRIKIRPGTPELPDSTDFVCGTLDEDRPMEDAYISCLAARRREKLQLIPQDIDPSFPASDPEDEGEEEIYNPVHHSSDDEDFLHGKMDDLHHEQDRRSRRRKSEHASPKRFRSPPPMKRRASPAPKARGRSPRRLFDGPSPRRLRSPPPTQMLRSPPASPRNARGAITFKTLASRPGLTVTKSLPRPPSMFPHMAKGRRSKAPASDIHVRGAIDIVKGLERKRQRRKEKFYQKYCNRARKGQIPDRKPQRGLGCERMRELGLLMAGKIEQGNYVLSV
ncbi:hypothetical protein CMUS01_05045 [Colletotrichum musicola]|uniref:Uncharacterized protein n=1 Tax=Colletotrichum musicola TaxID=2175873 RepID=A0A8H6KTH8_9PEZI|nr:hypothetical protein CMUS01_05045 [Colletotrichum musicola]